MLVSLDLIVLSNNNRFLIFSLWFLFTLARFFPPEKKGQVIVALIVSCSFSSIVELKSSVFDLSIDKVAVGARSDLDIFISFSDCSYSIFAIMIFGLLLIDNSIASFNDWGSGDIGFNDLFKSSILSIFPMTFS